MKAQLLKLQAACLEQFPHVRDGEVDPSVANGGMIATARELELPPDNENVRHVIHEAGAQAEGM